MRRDHAPVRLIGPERPGGRLDRLDDPLLKLLAEGPPVRHEELAALGVAEEIAEPVLGVAPGAAGRDPRCFRLRVRVAGSAW